MFMVSLSLLSEFLEYPILKSFKQFFFFPAWKEGTTEIISTFNSDSGERVLTL
jgi:hypothetical protein